MTARVDNSPSPLFERARQWILHAAICYPLTHMAFCALKTAGRFVPAGRHGRTD